MPSLQCDSNICSSQEWDNLMTVTSPLAVEVVPGRMAVASIRLLDPSRCGLPEVTMSPTDPPGVLQTWIDAASAPAAMDPVDSASDA